MSLVNGLEQKAIVPIGADPEFFLYDTKAKMNISAHGIIPGTKREPFKLKDGAVQLDGTAAEFNINPANSAEEFVYNINSVLAEIRAMVPEHIRFNYSSTVKYDETYFKDLVPNSCKELGCDPDFDAWNLGKVNVKPNNNSPMRTAGGHLHVGFIADNSADIKDVEHISDCITLTKQIDNYFRSFEYLWDKDQKRRSMYGKPGCFRPKQYGVEYRTLSNAWLSYPKLWPWLFDSLQFVTEQTLEGNIINMGSCGAAHTADSDFAFFNRKFKGAIPSYTNAMK